MWQCRPFAVGYLRNKDNNDSQSSGETDIYDVIATALRIGIRYEELGNMSLITLMNIIDAYMPKKHKPTQEEIDLIT